MNIIYNSFHKYFDFAIPKIKLQKLQTEFILIL